MSWRLFREMDKAALGAWGEQYAAKYLAQKGYEILETNYHAQGGEIDLVTKAPDGQWVLFEVKTRRSDQFGLGEDSITPQKVKSIQSAAVRYFLYQQKRRFLPEYDVQVILIYQKESKWFVEHLDNIGF